MRDPFQTLELPTTASMDEIKAAYRKLAKQYHPDLHPGDATAEQKMKELNEAYAEAVRVRKEGSYRPENYGEQAAGGYGPYGGAGGQWQGSGFNGQQSAWDPFGFGFPFGFAGFQQQSYQRSSTHYDDPELQAANDFILQGRYQEASNLLNRMTSHGPAWNYLSSLANLGQGNRIAALNYARQAAALDPSNQEYRELLLQLENTGRTYRRQGGTGGIGDLLCSNPFIPLMLCLCGGRYCWCCC